MRVGLLLALVVSVAPRAHAQALLITDFDGAAPLGGWRFDVGAEFPGASGTLTVGEGRRGTGLLLSWDFSGGGNYVQAIGEVSPLRTAQGVEVWARSDTGAGTSLRVIDSNGQTFQHRLPRRPDALDPKGWFRSAIDPSATNQTWGGPADGIYSGTIKAVSLTAGAPDDRAIEPVGAVAWDELASHATFAPSIDPFTTPIVEVPGAGPLGDRIVVDVASTASDATRAKLVEAGAGWARVRVDWATAEPEPGVFEFTELADTVDALRARGLKILFALEGTNPAHVGTSGESPRTGAARDAFGAFAAAVATRFGGGGVAYELWNRPDATWNPSANAEEFVALVAAASPRIRAADPAGLIVAGAIRHKPLLREALVAGLSEHVDAIAFHRDRFPEFVVSDWMALRRRQPPQVLRPVWNLGAGYSAQWFGDGASEDARRTQAVELLREVLLGWTLGQPGISVGPLQDVGVDSSAHAGLLTAEGADKPVLHALRTLTEQTRDQALIGVYSLTPTTLYGLKLEGRDRIVLVLWSAARRVTVDLKLPAPQSAVDVLGAPVATTLEDGSSGIRLDERTGPVYVVYPRPENGNADGGAHAPVLEPLLGWRCAATPTALPIPAAIVIAAWLAARRRTRSMERGRCWIDPARADIRP